MKRFWAVTLLAFMVFSPLPNAFANERIIRNVTPDNFTKAPAYEGVLERDESAPTSYPLARKVGIPVRNAVVLSATRLRFKDTSLTLNGIKGPDFSDWCDTDGKRHPCGRTARKALFDKVEFKLLTAGDELKNTKKAEQRAKHKLNETASTDILRAILTSINGSVSPVDLSKAVESMPALDARHLRKAYKAANPDVLLQDYYVCTECGQDEEMEIPLSADFLWPE